MRTETTVRTMRRDGEIWVHAEDLATFMTSQRRVCFQQVDDRGHEIFAWLSRIFETIVGGKDSVITGPLAQPPSAEELQQDLIVLHSELREGA